MYMCIHIYTYNIHMHTCICPYMCLYMYPHMYPHMYICMYTHTHIQYHILTFLSPRIASEVAINTIPEPTTNAAPNGWPDTAAE